VIHMVLSHRKELITANIIAILGTMVSVPVPLLIPLLVDEVLLDKPGTLISLSSRLFPESWQGPVLYISAVLLLTLVLRFFALIFSVWQMRESFMGKFYQILVECSADIYTRGGFVQIAIANPVVVQDAARDCG